LLARRGGGQIQLSLSHTQQHACAVALLEGPVGPRVNAPRA
jgi:phosphopantetheinyl transferase (holo-ACP synthase)